jgi:hypothetical protein
MFITLEEFFNNYRIKNQQQPNETILNRGIMRLKRETRELKSVLDILLGNELEMWDTYRIYEKDEYVKHGNLIYKSKTDTNLQHTPFREDTVYWDIVTISELSSKTKIQSEEFISTIGQTHFITSFNIDNEPMIFIEGILLDSSRYTKINNTEIVLNDGLAENEHVVITCGVTYDSSAIVSKQNFVSTAGQTVFTCNYILKSPSVFVDGLLIDQVLYIYHDNILTFSTGLSVGKKVVIANGNILGSDVYSTQNVDDLLDLKCDILDSYSISDIDGFLNLKANIQYVDELFDEIGSLKADKATSLSGYGIIDAYTKTQIDTSLATKLNIGDFTDLAVLNKIKSVDGEGSGLNADTLDGYDAERFIKNDIANSKFFNFEILNVDDMYADELIYNNRIIFDVQSITPKITFRKYNESQEFEEALVYTDKNTSNVMIIREGYFKGVWEPTLNNTFGINNWNEYNWTVSVTPTVIGFEHDYNSILNHTPFSGFDTDNVWDNDDSEYHYAYVENSVINLKSIHRIGNSVVDIPARYHLIGVLKSFSSYAQVNQI